MSCLTHCTELKMKHLCWDFAFSTLTAIFYIEIWYKYNICVTKQEKVLGTYRNWSPLKQQLPDIATLLSRNIHRIQLMLDPSRLLCLKTSGEENMKYDNNEQLSSSKCKNRGLSASTFIWVVINAFSNVMTNNLTVR